MSAPDPFLKPYQPSGSEKLAQSVWDESGYANPDTMEAAGLCDNSHEPFSMVLPPPNVTGSLHTGHALMLAIQDTMTRFARMQGRPTLWLPGTDHAAIATQSKVEKLLEKDGVRKNDLGREEFLRRVNEYAQNSHDTIVNQTKAMGASLDWSREAYTLDEARNLAVRTAFKQMFDDGLVYRDYKIVNWDPKGQTTISDDEIVNEERASKLYTFKYSHDFPIPIATTRPETKIGDVAVAVHPDDARYAEFVDQEYSCNFCGSPITIRIIADETVEPDFGTGALGVTPAHSHMDWDIAKRHNLPIKPIINEFAKMTIGDERILGKKTTEVRETVVQWLRDEGLMISEEDITQNVPTAERTGAIIEPLPKLQWFVAVEKPFTLRHSEIDGINAGDTVTLKQLMLSVVKNNQVSILPERFNDTYFHWINNLRDWCISRQIWFGHRIPVWYRAADLPLPLGEGRGEGALNQSPELHCGIEAPAGEGWEQDPDTLDTWFSSGLWTFSTLGWPNTEAPDFKRFHPTNILETGYDLLFFWIARMILMSTYLVGQVPFKQVYFHGMVRAANGQKMSKSLGNAAVDPLDLIAKYGADSVRMALIVGNGPGQDIKLLDDKIKAYSKFANKIWNMTRYILECTDPKPEGFQHPEYITTGKSVDEWSDGYTAELNTLILEVTNEMQTYKYHLASEKLYHYIWHTFADKIIEESKYFLNSETESDRVTAHELLIHQMRTCLKLLHPFMPHITERIWQELPSTWKQTDQPILMVSRWPSA